MKKMNKKGQSGILIFIGILAVIGLFVGLAVFDTVDASHKGVKVKLGKIVGTMDPGIEATGLFVAVHSYDLRLRKMDVNMEGVQGAVDKDGQSVFANIQINYKVNPQAIVDLYSEVGRDKSGLAATLNIDGIVREGFKSVTSQYSSLEIFQKRSEIKQKAIEQIKKSFPKNYFFLENVIVSNLDFNPEFKAAIEGRKTAEEEAKRKEQEVKVAEMQAKINEAEAEGKKQVRIKEAEAEAQVVLQKAKAEAEGLRLKKAELTPMMVQNNWIDAWNGQLPQNTNMLMQMPTGNQTN